MLKKIVIFLIVSVVTFSVPGRISDVKTLSAKIDEITYLNGDKKEKIYSIEYISPNFLTKIMEFPKINKGEIFQYNGDKKYIYIPLFDEIVEEENKDEEVSSFLAVINYLKEKDLKDEEFSKNYYDKKLKELKYQNGYTIQFDEYKEINNILIPIKFSILENDIKLATLQLSNVEINEELIKKELK